MTRLECLESKIAEQVHLIDLLSSDRMYEDVAGSGWRDITDHFIWRRKQKIEQYRGEMEAEWRRLYE